MRKFSFGMIASVTLLISTLSHAAGSSSPVGLWKTIDDATGQPKAIVQIAEMPDHSLSGKIIKIFPRPGYDQNEVCEACKGELHNQKIVGLTILNNLHANKKDSKEWVDGQILDPMNGKTYDCHVQLVQDDQKLKVRGFIGLPLFGRSQVWEKENS